MGDRRFDGLTRVVGGWSSRRGLLRSALAAGLAGLAARRSTAGVDAACPPDQVQRGRTCVCRTTGRPPGPDGCPCRQGQEKCGGVCVSPSMYRSDPANCGRCGAPCGAGAGCVAGSCEAVFTVANVPATWTVPSGVSLATFAVSGAQGGTAIPGLAPVPGGLGGRMDGTFAVAQGEGYDLIVGAAGADGGKDTIAPGGAGFGTGGDGGSGGVAGGGSGGGASAVSRAGTVLIVAGGGGGAGATVDPGGAGGGTAGAPGSGNTPGGGGTGSAGGAAGGNGATAGQFGLGGNGRSGSYGGGGGGGGYYGGGGGGSFTLEQSGGGGGSGFVAPGAGNVSEATGVQSGNGLIVVTYAVS